jgi:acyl-CoA thioesterase-1
MTVTLHFSLLVALLPFAASAIAAEPKPAAKADKKAPHPAFAKIEDVPGLPRVLLIGDSISIGYTADVRKLLEGRANVHRIPENGGPTKNGLAKLSKWLGDGKWDVIHFNWGLHDLKYMPDGKRQVEPEAYEQNLRELVRQMKATGAKLIWCSTTPVPEGELNPKREFGDAPAYNLIAARVMRENGVMINDLYTWAQRDLARIQKPKDVHFTPEGSAYLARRVAESIRGALKP